MVCSMLTNTRFIAEHKLLSGWRRRGGHTRTGNSGGDQYRLETLSLHSTKNTEFERKIRDKSKIIIRIIKLGQEFLNYNAN